MKKEKKTLKQLRKEIRFTQREVSNESGVPFSTYVAYEMGYRKPSLENAQKLANFFKCKVDEIDFSAEKQQEG